MAVKPTLQPSEITLLLDAFKAGLTIHREVLTSGSFIARAGNKRLFATGGRESFDKLWAEAQSLKENL